MEVSSGKSVMIAGAVAVSVELVNTSVAVSAAGPRIVMTLPSWFTAGVFFTWKTASAGGLITPVVAAINGICHMTWPFAGLHVSVEEAMLTFVCPVHVVPDCNVAATVTFCASVA